MTNNLSGYYNESFYDYNISRSLRSAQIFLQHLSGYIKPSSIIDIGCGRGTWLKAAEDLGARELVGLDGIWNDGKLLSSSIKFTPVDLEKLESSKASGLYDLAISLEVAEHLGEEYADNFVSYICSTSDLVLFAAASKYQGGTNHLNEQFPSYWAQLFQKRDFYPLDLFRPKFWGNNQVEACYRQNTFLYIRKNSNVEQQYFSNEQKVDREFMDCIHPDIYLNRSGRQVLYDFLRGVRYLIKRKLSAKIRF
jgi:hypothetical protein